MDVWFYGLQLTLQVQPGQLLSDEQQGVRHFGVTLNHATLDELLTRLQELPVHGSVRCRPTPSEHPRGKTSAKIADPSGNVIELKSYDDPKAAPGAS